jgi:CubicO group peptidase (beta-lactamase class C family)
MQLQQEGKLKLDDNLATYLPQYTAEAGQKVTLRQLLTHTSGMLTTRNPRPIRWMPIAPHFSWTSSSRATAVSRWSRNRAPSLTTTTPTIFC